MCDADYSNLVELDILDSKSLRKEVWRDEARNFTPWLAEQGIRKLGDELGMSLVFDEIESRAGRYRVDILAHIDVGEDGEREYVVIENQLEQTNHDHLGKSIVYAAKKNARHIVWVVPDVTDEHGETIAWLNRHTTSSLRFYLVKVVVVRLAEGRFGFKFDVVERPDEDEKEITETPTEKGYRAFWTGFRDFALSDRELSGMVPSFQKGLPQNWYNVHFGTSSCKYILSISGGRCCVRVEASTPDGLSRISENENAIRECLGDAEYVPFNESLKKSRKCPNIKFFNPVLTRGSDKAAYEWYKKALLALTPRLREIFGLRA